MPDFVLYRNYSREASRKENEMASDQARSRGGGRERVHGDGMATAPADTLGYADR
jgi:hypothetical protein